MFFTIAINVDFVLHQFKPFYQGAVCFKEFLVLRNKSLDEDWSLRPKLLGEVGSENLHTYVTKKLLSLDQIVNVLVMQA